MWDSSDQKEIVDSGGTHLATDNSFLLKLSNICASAESSEQVLIAVITFADPRTEYEMNVPHCPVDFDPKIPLPSANEKEWKTLRGQADEVTSHLGKNPSHGN